MVQNAATTTTKSEPGARLGNTIKSVNKSSKRTSNYHYYRLQDTSKTILTGYAYQAKQGTTYKWAVLDCLEHLVPERRAILPDGSKVKKPAKGTVKVAYNPNTGSASYRGLAVCGNVWTCPVCSRKITARRREELRTALEHWPGAVIMATVTLQHDREEKLDSLLDALRESWQAVKTGGDWPRIKKEYGIAAEVTALEFTWGSANGWHPHLHVLLFMRERLQNDDICQLKNTIYYRYKSKLATLGRYASHEFGIVISTKAETTGDYVAKYGLEFELASLTTKKSNGGFTPWQMLERAAAGDKMFVHLFREYATATRGRRQLVYSAHAKEILGISDLTDDEIAAEELEPERELIQLSFWDYCTVVKAGKRADLLKVAEERGEPLDIACWLISEFGIFCKVIAPGAP